MGHMGFSYIGLLWLLMLFIPNLIWSRNQPVGYSAQKENKILLLQERVGQVCVTTVALIFTDFNWKPFTPWNLWLIFSFALMLLYECYWARYFRGKKTLQDFYGSFCGVPVAGATLPVLAFLLLGIYGKVIWMILSVLLLGIGHIGIHFQHRKEGKPDGGKPHNDLKILAFSPPQAGEKPINQQPLGTKRSAFRAP